MLKEDFVIQSNVRRVLIRSNIDYSEITFGTVRGVVYLRGIFKLARFYTDGSTENAVEFTMKNLQSLERKIRSIPGVIDIVFEFVNWKKEKGQWVPKNLQEDG
jgi:hypothetical protein